MQHLQEWAAKRVAAGGSGVKVRLVKGANLSMEIVEAVMHGWPLTTWDTKQAADTNYKRVLDYALRPEHVKNIRLGIAGHNLFDVAFALLLSEDRGVKDRVEFEMLIGMAEQQAEIIRRRVGHLLLYVPVVNPKVPASKRTQNRLTENEDNVFVPAGRFENTPDTDPALAGNREWGRAILERSKTTKLGIDTLKANELTSEAEAEKLIKEAEEAGKAWGKLSGGKAIALHRGDLLEVMAAEAGKTLEQGDTEVSEAIDFAYYYAMLAEDLEKIDGAKHKSVDLTLVVPPWNFPTAIPAGGVLAGLAAGNHYRTYRCADRRDYVGSRRSQGSSEAHQGC